MTTAFKNQYNPFMWLSYVVAILSLLTNVMGGWLVYLLLGLALIGVLIFVHKTIKKTQVEIFDLLGMVFLVFYTCCVLLIPLFDMLLVLFSCLLLISTFVCMLRCREEDAKAIAILHVIYIFSCNLTMPCIGVSI